VQFDLVQLVAEVGADGVEELAWLVVRGASASRPCATAALAEWLGRALEQGKPPPSEAIDSRRPELSESPRWPISPDVAAREVRRLAVTVGAEHGDVLESVVEALSPERIKRCLRWLLFVLRFRTR
jgi:hypothetical protein